MVKACCEFKFSTVAVAHHNEKTSPNSCNCSSPPKALQVQCLLSVCQALDIWLEHSLGRYTQAPYAISKDLPLDRRSRQSAYYASAWNGALKLFAFATFLSIVHRIWCKAPRCFPFSLLMFACSYRSKSQKARTVQRRIYFWLAPLIWQYVTIYKSGKLLWDIITNTGDENTMQVLINLHVSLDSLIAWIIWKVSSENHISWLSLDQSSASLAILRCC